MQMANEMTLARQCPPLTESEVKVGVVSVFAPDDDIREKLIRGVFAPSERVGPSSSVESGKFDIEAPRHSLLSRTYGR